MAGEQWASKHLPIRQSGHGADEWQMQLHFPSASCEPPLSLLRMHQSGLNVSDPPINEGAGTEAQHLETEDREVRVQAPSPSPALGPQRFSNASQLPSTLTDLSSQTHRDESK